MTWASTITRDGDRWARMEALTVISLTVLGVCVWGLCGFPGLV